MEFKKAKRDDIVVEFRGAKFTFAPSCHQDVVYCTTLLDYLQGENLKVTRVSRDECIDHVFKKLRSVEGVKANGVDATVEQMVEISKTSQSVEIIPIVASWAVKVAVCEGLLPEAEEKKSESVTSNSSDSSQQSSISPD